MLRVTLNKDDYVMIGDDIRLQYKRNTGQGTFSIAISAPRDVAITRKSLYEGEIKEMAGQGDIDAQFLLDLLQEEGEERQRISNLRRAKQQFHRAKAKEGKAK